LGSESGHAQMPAHAAFRGVATYAAVRHHELLYGTAARPRRNRSAKVRHVREELIAELGSCFVCADLGVARPRGRNSNFAKSSKLCRAMAQGSFRREAGNPPDGGAGGAGGAFPHRLQPSIAELLAAA